MKLIILLSSGLNFTKMTNKTYFIPAFLFFLFFISCSRKENTPAAQPRVNIHLPVTSANVVFHIKENKVTSYEILNEDGSPITDQIVYRRIGVTGDQKCYRCPGGETDTEKCTEIPCPPDPCKEIYCGPLNFEIYDKGSSSAPGKMTGFSVVADGIKK